MRNRFLPFARLDVDDSGLTAIKKALDLDWGIPKTHQVDLEPIITLGHLDV